MALFSRKKDAVPTPTQGGALPEHAVILHYKLSDDDYGTEQEREGVYELQDRLRRAIRAASAGEFDGNEIGGGKAVLYMYGHDKDRLWSAVEAEARGCPFRPAYALLRAGGPGTTPEQVHL